MIIQEQSTRDAFHSDSANQGQLRVSICSPSSVGGGRLRLSQCQLVCRSEQLSSADKAAVRRLVTSAFQRVIATGGQSLGEVNTLLMVLDCRTLNKLTRPPLHDEVMYKVSVHVGLKHAGTMWQPAVLVA